MKAAPVIAWMGGKRRLAKTIVPMMPKHVRYVEPFCGGAAILFAKQPSKAEVINDVNGELVNLYRVLRHHHDEFLRQFDYQLLSRFQFDEMKGYNLEHLTDIQRAARFFWLQKNCFGSVLKNHAFGTGRDRKHFSPKLLRRNIEAAQERLQDVVVEHKHWHDVVQLYDAEQTLFYFDPPYYETKGYGVDFDFHEYEKIEATMRTMKGKAILSINGHPEIKALFKGFEMVEVDHDYTCAGKGNRKKASEVIYRNFDLEASLL